MRPSPVSTPPSGPSTLSVPARIEWQALNCPACNEPLDLDRDGTSCTRCRGLLVQRVWADRLLPAMGRPALPPVFQSTPRDLECPACRRGMSPVLMHGVAAWSCAACRWLFIEGPRKAALLEPNAPVVAAPPTRALAKPSFIMVATERAKDAAKSPKLRDALAILVLVALIVAVVVVEVRPT
jgi:ribosomal protein L37AE/L43A